MSLGTTAIFIIVSSLPFLFCYVRLLLSMDREPKNYELAYVLSPMIPEEEILQKAGQITTLIEENKGLIRHVQEPRKIKLAYPVKKERTAYFGYTTFALAPEFLLSLEKKIKGGEILRRLLVEEEIGRRPPAFRAFTSRPAPLPRQKVAPREEPKVEEKLDLEALDKKLEEILGK